MTEERLFSWAVVGNEVHTPHSPPESECGNNGTPFIVQAKTTGPEALTLERALALSGRLSGARQADPDNPQLSQKLPHVRLESITVTIGTEKRPVDNWARPQDWPQRADRIVANVLWHENGKPSREAIETDLALPASSSPSHPADAQPAITKHSRLNVEELTNVLLAAYSGAENEVWPDDVEEHRAAAKAVAEIAVNGDEGRLTAIERLIAERVVPCLPAGTTKGTPVQVQLFGTETGRPEARTNGTYFGTSWVPERDRRRTRERHNGLRYEGTPFAGHVGLLPGTPLEEHTALWNELLERRTGEILWELDHPVRGLLVKLSEKEQASAYGLSPIPATHATTWSAVDKGTRLEAVHLLDHKEVDNLRQRVAGLLIDEMIAYERKTPTEALGSGHPVKLLANEYRRRRRHPPAGGQAAGGK